MFCHYHNNFVCRGGRAKKQEGWAGEDVPMRQRDERMSERLHAREMGTQVRKKKQGGRIHVGLWTLGRRGMMRAHGGVLKRGGRE